MCVCRVGETELSVLYCTRDRSSFDVCVEIVSFFLRAWVFVFFFFFIVEVWGEIWGDLVRLSVRPDLSWGFIMVYGVGRVLYEWEGRTGF